MHLFQYNFAATLNLVISLLPDHIMIWYKCLDTAYFKRDLRCVAQAIWIGV